jgi:hypothetical protein
MHTGVLSSITSGLHRLKPTQSVYPHGLKAQRLYRLFCNGRPYTSCAQTSASPYLPLA